MNVASSRSRAAGALAFMIAVQLSSRALHAEDSCNAAFVAGQQAFSDRKLIDARARFKSCSAASCPTMIRNDCTEFLEKVRTLMPSIVLVARVGTKPVVDVAVSVDGKPLLEKLDGKAIEIDPGEHTFRFTDTSKNTLEVKQLVVEGKSGQEVEAAFPAPAPLQPEPETTTTTKPPAPVPLTGAETPANGASSSGSTLGRIGMVTVGIGVVGISVGTILALNAYSSWDEAKAKCPGGSCDEKDEVMSRYQLGIGIAVAGGLMLVGGGALWAMASRSPTGSKMSGIQFTRLAITPGGFKLEGSF